MKIVELKPFVPSLDLKKSIDFYETIGFEVKWNDDELAFVKLQESSFLLQSFDNIAFSDNYMIHLLVEDVMEWWGHFKTIDFTKFLNVTFTEPVQQPWNMLEFVFTDPSGVLWRVGQNN